MKGMNGRSSGNESTRAQRGGGKASLTFFRCVLTTVAVTCLLFYFTATVLIIHSDKKTAERIFHDDHLYANTKKSEFVENKAKPSSSDIADGKVDKSVDAKKDEVVQNQVEQSSSSAADGSKADGSKAVKRSDSDSPSDYVLSAYTEPIYQEDWLVKPLPKRNTTASILQKQTFQHVNSCSNLPSQWPINEDIAPTNKDPFLPWIHDVFPSADGKFIQFIAQNKRRCQSGRKKGDIKKFMQPNIALFQHVPIKRVETTDGASEGDSKSTRYRLTSHEEADPDGIETRFICRFKPSMEETLSVHNLNYDYHTLRKAYRATFTEEGFDNHMIWSSQLLFKCPVPESLQEKIRLGQTVVDDYATQFVDLIPIRTPPRYGLPTTYLPPRLFSDDNTWNATLEWGDSHVLPSITDSGRWENIPICKPSLMQYPDAGAVDNVVEHDAKMAEIAQKGEKKKLISCTWTSSSFKTRGGRTQVNDGDQRLLQWLEFNKMVGVDHVYIYDNSGSFSEDSSLEPVTDMFPGFVTRINWPAKVCNNNPGNTDNKGERSSQYAATMDCHLRFGAHSDWLASFDTDEYMTPLGKYDDLKALLNDMEKKDIKVLNWKSKRSKPRLNFFNLTKPDDCARDECFDPIVPKDKTFLEVYNCNIEKPPRKDTMPAEKAIYRPDYVLLFFVHYATVTTRSQMGKPETLAKGQNYRARYRPQQHSKFTDEETQGTMLHSKAIVQKETYGWKRMLQRLPTNSKIGVEWPRGKDLSTDEKLTVPVEGEEFKPNCYPVEKIDDYWVPKLVEALKKRGWGAK